MYKLNLVDPNGQTIESFNVWPSAELSEEQKNEVNDNFYNLSDAEELNEMSNDIAQAVETHYDTSFSQNDEITDNVTSEIGETEEEPAVS